MRVRVFSGARLGLLLCSLLLAGAALAGDPIRHVFTFRDGGNAIWYETGERLEDTDTVVFFYGGTGCYSWKRMLPDLAQKMGIKARYIALNKREVSDDEEKISGCTQAFYALNSPRQWMSDYMEFLSAQTGGKRAKLRNIVLVGASEGGALAVRVARARTDITHLLIIGDGGWSMRDNLDDLIGKQQVDDAWREIAADPNSLQKTWLGHPYRYWFDILDQEPLPDYLALDIPVLIGIGEHDTSLPAYSAVAVRNAADRAGKRNIGVVVYPDADHRLQAPGHDYLSEFLHRAAADIASGNAK